jgi:hypothetical protein
MGWLDAKSHLQGLTKGGEGGLFHTRANNPTNHRRMQIMGCSSVLLLPHPPKKPVKAGALVASMASYDSTSECLCCPAFCLREFSPGAQNF